MPGGHSAAELLQQPVHATKALKLLQPDARSSGVRDINMASAQGCVKTPKAVIRSSRTAPGTCKRSSRKNAHRPACPRYSFSLPRGFLPIQLAQQAEITKPTTEPHTARRVKNLPAVWHSKVSAAEAPHLSCTIPGLPLQSCPKSGICACARCEKVSQSLGTA